MSTPSFTAAQFVAVIGAALTIAASFGFNLSASERDAILQLATVIFPVIVAADALIRHGRSKVAATIAAQAVTPAKPAE